MDGTSGLSSRSQRIIATRTALSERVTARGHQPCQERNEAVDAPFSGELLDMITSKNSWASSVFWFTSNQIVPNRRPEAHSIARGERLLGREFGDYTLIRRSTSGIFDIELFSDRNRNLLWDAYQFLE